MAEMVTSTPRPTSAAAGSVDREELEQPLVLVLASDLRLVSDAVAAALASLGFRVSVLNWPRTRGAGPVQRQIADVGADVAVLIYDVDLAIRMAEAVALIKAWSGPWLVLTGVPPGPAWGGLALAGTVAVRSSDVTLAEVADLVRRLAAGGPDPMASDLAVHVESWRAVQARNGELQRRIDSLAPRELEVLTLLYQGVGVTTVARRLGLSVTTVRGQVRAILRKLDARSQLAAVAMLHEIDRAGLRPSLTQPATPS